MTRGQLVTGLLLTLISASMSIEAVGQTTQPLNVDWDFRYDLFQSVLEEQGLKPISNATNVLRNPKESVIILLGRVDGLTPGQVQQFCSNGGAILIARDSEAYLGSMCSFRSGAVTTNAESSAYQGHRDCLLLTNINTDHRLMRGVGSLVVNKAGWLSSPRWATYEVNPAAGYDNQTNPANSRNQSVVATLDAFRGSEGELIVCSDQSLFTNGMLWHADNSLFVINVAQALSGSNRKFMHVVADGQPLGRFTDSPMLPPQNTPPLPPLTMKDFLRMDTDSKDVIINSVAKSNLINELLANQPRNVNPSRYRRAILFGFGILALLIFFWLMMKRFGRVGEAMPVREMQTASALRTDRKVAESNFGYAASMLARDFCRELTDSGDRADWLRTLRAKVDSGRPIVQQVAYQSPLNRVVDLAVNSQKIRLSTKDFTSLGEDINTLRKLHRNGRLLIPAGETSL